MARRGGVVLLCAVLLAGCGEGGQGDPVGGDDEAVQAIAADFTRPWSERRGIETIDVNQLVVLVRAPLTAVTDVLAPRAREVRRDVLGAEADPREPFALVHQLTGQAWTLVSPSGRLDLDRLDGGLAGLSAALGADVVELRYSDTSGDVGYRRFAGGALVEEFAGTEGGSDDPPGAYRPATDVPFERYELTPYAEDEEDDGLAQVAYAWSAVRPLSAEVVGNVWTFPDETLRALDAYDPGFGVDDFLGGGTGAGRVGNPGRTLVLGGGREVTATPEFAGVDLLQF